MKNLISLILIIPFILFQPAKACTTAVISGKYTKDGRPLLWKHRDTWALNNSIRQFDDGKYPYMGLVNSKDIEGKATDYLFLMSRKPVDEKAVDPKNGGRLWKVTEALLKNYKIDFSKISNHYKNNSKLV